MGKVTLIGAGPGDAGLITVKGWEKLKTCDVVIYDRLASEELLNAVKEDCVRVYVGKRPGAHSMKQEEINQVLVEYGKKYADVVRLKGGDSFVFGRGGEEIQALQEARIPYEVIPGITSSIAVPEIAGIPVTHRGVARSFHVITGHTMYDLHTEDAESTVTDNYETLAKLEGTLVFLMGLSNLGEITAQLLRFGKSANTPAAVIAKGTTPYEKTVRGTLSDITVRVQEAGLESPVVIVIGETAEFHFKMEENGGGKKYGMTGTARTMEAFRRALSERAAVAVPLIKMRVCGTEQIGELEQELEHIPDYDWILFTSKQAVDTFFQTFFSRQADIRTLGGCRFGAIGQGSFDALSEYGIYADFMPERADAESFARQFARHYAQHNAVNNAQHNAGEMRGQRVLVPRARQGSPVLGKILREAGMQVREIPIYDVTGESYENFSEIPEIRDFVFFSASGVRAFFSELAERKMKVPAGSRCYCIGHLTSRALEKAVAETDADSISIITADEQSVAGLVQKIAENMDK